MDTAGSKGRTLSSRVGAGASRERQGWHHRVDEIQDEDEGLEEDGVFEAHRRHVEARLKFAEEGI